MIKEVVEEEKEEEAEVEEIDELKAEVVQEEAIIDNHNESRMEKETFESTAEATEVIITTPKIQVMTETELHK